MDRRHLRILFYHGDTSNTNAAWLLPTALVLKTYLDVKQPEIAQQLEWCLPIQLFMSDEELIAKITEHDPDVLCTSHYLWNHEVLIQQLARIKNKLNKKIKLIAGGPSITVHIDPEFFTKYPFVDYAVYGHGEFAFADIVTNIMHNRDMIAFNASNCAWQKSNKTIVAEHKPVSMLSTSPYIHNKQMLVDMVEDFKKQTTAYSFIYSLTRGCPYACTFCDWNSGLSNKVSRRTATYQQEIDLFQELGIIEIYLADANVGQYDEDIEMIEYFARKNLEENVGFHIAGNYSKLRKDAKIKIYNLLAEGKLIRRTFNFAIQDVNETVLQNIDRPDIGWAAQTAMIDELQKKHPQYYVKTELVYGLPGQTVESWRQSLKTITQKRLIIKPFFNEPLPASPALIDPEYQKKFQFEYVYSKRISTGLENYYSMLPVKCVSFSQIDLVRMTVLSTLYTALSVIKTVMSSRENIELDIEPVVDDIIESENYKSLINNLYSNWVEKNNFFYTIDLFGNPEYSTADPMFLGQFWVQNKDFIKLIAKSIPVIQANKLIQLFYSKIYKDDTCDILSEPD